MMAMVLKNSLNESEDFSLHNWDNPQYPILLSVPHAGRIYPQELLDHLRVPVCELVRLEDRYADRLVQSGIATGFPAIIAHKARAWIDLNRAESDIDNAMVRSHIKLHFDPSTKTRGGLGLIPRRLSGCGELWKAPHDWHRIEERISSYYHPYHDAIENYLTHMRDHFGVAILLDVHSMPPLTGQNSWNNARIIVGDRFGKSASARYSESILAEAAQHGLKAALNHPYPGDHMLRRHGQPQRNIHAIQIEIDRSLYLDDLLREVKPEMSVIAMLIQDIALSLSQQAGWNMPIAAE
jgi:N-formylglutamate amidohydrolase